MEFLGGWNKEEDDEEGDGIILSFFFFFLGETFGLVLDCYKEGEGVLGRNRY